MRQAKKWKIEAVDQDLQSALSKSLSVSKMLAGILIKRGFCEAESVKKFFYGEEQTIDPFLLKGMDVVVPRIKQAIERAEKITVYGDYDVDGITSTALMVKTLGACGAKVEFYIPEREKEGYGIHAEALASIVDGGSTLLVTVDCGISAVQEVSDYKDAIDIIITDHHMAPDVLPPALAILNPKQADCNYPDKSLAGVGVAYQLCQALCLDFAVPAVADALEIAALGTIADVVPLIGENRRMVKQGLVKLNESQNIGLKALIEECSLTGKKIDSGHVGFILAPRLNAAGRLGSAKAAVELLLTEDETYAKKLAQTLNFENEQRQLIEKEILLKAEAYITDIVLEEAKVLVVSGANWNPGVIGIVASRLVERYYRPTIVLTEQDGIAKGSCRSIQGFNIYEALKACEDLLEGYGGHSLAAGLTILPENIALLHERLNQLAQKTLTDEDYIPVMQIDAALNPVEINEAIIEELTLLEPYGMGNHRPLFALTNVDLLEAKPMGREGTHLRFKVAGKSGQLNGIAWNMGSMAETLNSYGKIDVAFQPEINEWQGKRSVQIKAQDIRPYRKEITEIDRLFLDAAADDLYQDIGSAKQFFTKAVGVSFDNRQAVIAGLKAGDVLALKREANNPYDKNAIAVQTAQGEAVGFIRAQIAAKLSPQIDGDGAQYGVRVTDITGSVDKNLGVNLLVFQIEEKLSFARTYKTISQSEVCREILGDRTYHEAQINALAALAAGKNTLVIMGTGRGKSAIFQTYAAMAAINQSKLTVIVYPLRALVNDQYLNLKKLFSRLGIAVYKGNGTLSTGERGVLFEALANKEVDVLLTTPEFLEANALALKIKEQDIGLFVVDECHHIAKDSRRAAYKHIDKTVKQLGNPMVLGVTATADGVSAEVIKRGLNIEIAVIDKTVRENLAVCDRRNCHDKSAYIGDIVKKGEKVLVFVNSRKKAVEIAAALRERYPDAAEKIGFYHAGLSNEWRIKVETWFKDGTLQVVVATSAFGEGVDLPDIRHVIQYHLPFDMTSFNQQCGRVGRDGNSGMIHLLFGQDDIKFNRLILKERAPERELIGKIYLVLKNSQDNEGKIEVTNGEIARLCTEKYQAFIGEAGVSSCLKILEELQLISRETFEGKRTIFFNAVSGVKMDLMQSAAYVEGVNERDAFEKFAADVLKLTAEALLDVINKPIYPND